MKVEIAAAAVICLASFGVLRSTLRAQSPAVQPPGTQSDKSLRSVWDGVYTEEQAKRGQPIYSQHCSACHGVELTGRESAGPLAGAMFTANWNGVTLGDMLERIRVSMPQDQPGRLSRQQYTDVVAYILKFNKFPVGKTELPRQTEVLKQIRFEATKP